MGAVRRDPSRLGYFVLVSKQIATNLRKASARWLIACLAAGSISPKV
jgi:hypothetical protein